MISVIIPTGSGKINIKILDEIKKINAEEIIIVGRNIATDNLDNKTIIYETNGNKNPAENRNFGASKANSDYLLFIDDDVLIDHNYINKKFSKDILKYDLYYGIYSTKDSNKNYTDFFENEINRHRKLKCDLFSSSHFLIKKNIFYDLGGFNDELDTYEDIEFYNRCLNEKIKIYFDKSFEGRH